MKPMLRFIAVAAVFFAITGCLMPERIENRVRYMDPNTPPQITVIWHNISSDAKNEQELKKDFEELIKNPDSTGTDIFIGFEKDIIIKEWQVYVEDGKINLYVSGIPQTGQFEDITSNGERMIVLDMEEAGVVETNGKLLKTDENYIIVWPESLKEISWSNRLRTDESDIDWIRWEQNRPKLLKMFETYKQQRGK